MTSVNSFLRTLRPWRLTRSYLINAESEAIVAAPYTLPIGEAQPHGPHRRAVGRVGASYQGSTSKGRWTSTSPGGLPVSAGCSRPRSRTRLYRPVCETMRTSENRYLGEVGCIERLS